MALPSSGYDTFTITNPLSALTDFSFIVDLSNMSSSWWSAVDINNGTYGRAAKGDGVIELACDWIDFDHVAKTGLLRVKWSGTLASTGTQTIRIYPPQITNGSYSASDTYGQYNAYDSSIYAYYPLSDANDRTSNQRTLSAQNGATFGGGSSPIGESTSFTGTEYAIIESTIDFTSNDWSFLALLNFDDVSDDKGIWGSDSQSPQIWMDNASPDRFSTYAAGTPAYGTTSISASSWYGLCSKIGSSEVSTITNGSDKQTGTFVSVQSSVDMLLGRTSTKYNDGFISQALIVSSLVSDNFAEYEYSQTSDNSTFWGTATWVAPSTGSNISAISNNYRRRKAG